MKTFTAADRTSLIKLASSLPEGDETRKAILAGLMGKEASDLSSVAKLLVASLEKFSLGNDDKDLSKSLHILGTVLTLIAYKRVDNPEYRTLMTIAGSVNSLSHSV